TYIFLYNECGNFIEYQICGNSVTLRSSVMSVMAVDDVSVRVANGYIQKDKEASKEEEREQANRRGQLTNVTFVELSSRADDIKAGLIDTFLNLQLIDSNLYLARHLLKGRQSLPAVYGGQVIGQALAAASATVDDTYKPHSLHSYFIQTGSVHKPILYMVDRVSDRRSFCTRVVKAIQEGQAIFTCQVSFHKDEPDSVTHQHEMPKVAPPEELRDFREIIEDSLRDEMVTTAMKAMLKYKLNEMPPAFARIFEFRPVDRDIYGRGCVEGRFEPRSSMWLRTKENIGDDPRLHQCVAAYISDCSMLETAIKPHSSRGFIPSMAFSLDHCVWIHNWDFRVDEWMLYENYSPVARGSRGFIEGRLWTRDGRLILSSAQEGLIRSSKYAPYTRFWQSRL
uniref:Acyl-CoA thioesterase II n=1 Tax=Parascaris univalens TaxID=6257 RepID=A0A915AGT6_PARUN